MATYSDLYSQNFTKQWGVSPSEVKEQITYQTTGAKPQTIGIVLKSGETRYLSDEQIKNVLASGGTENPRQIVNTPISQQSNQTIEYVSTPKGVIPVSQYKAQQGMAQTPIQLRQGTISSGQEVFRNLPQQSVVPKPSQTPLETVKERIGNIKSNIVNTWGGMTQTNERNKLTETTQRDVMSGKRVEPFTQSGRGTMVTTNKPYTNEELLLAATGRRILPNEPVTPNIPREAAYQEIQRRTIEDRNTQFNQVVNYQAEKLQREGQNKINLKYNELNTQVQEGKLTADEATQRLKDYASIIDYENELNLYIFVNRWEREKGSKIDSQNKEYLKSIQTKMNVGSFIETLPITVSTGMATGQLSTIPKIPTALNLLGLGSLGVTSYQIAKYRKELSPSDYALMAAEIVVFTSSAYGGAKGITKAMSQDKIDRVQAALNRASYKQLTPKLITREGQLAKYSIPEDNRPILKDYIKKGSTIRETGVKIVPKNSQDAELIRKTFPDLEIKGYDVTNQEGIFIDRVGVGKVKVITGKNVYVEDILSRTSGIKTSPTEAVTKTVTLIGEETPKEVIVSKENIKSLGTKTIKTEPKTLVNLDEGSIKKIEAANLRQSTTKINIEELGRKVINKKFNLQNINELLDIQKGKKTFEGTVTRIEKRTKSAGVSVINEKAKPVLFEKEVGINNFKLESIPTKESSFAKMEEFIGKEQGTFNRITEKQINKASKYNWETKKIKEPKVKVQEPIPTIEDEYTKALIEKYGQEKPKGINEEYPKIVGGEGKTVSAYDFEVKKANYDVDTLIKNSPSFNPQAIESSLNRISGEINKPKQVKVIPVSDYNYNEIKGIETINVNEFKKLSTQNIMEIKNKQIDESKLTNAITETYNPLNEKQINKIITSQIETPTFKQPQIEQPKFEQPQINIPRLSNPNFPDFPPMIYVPGLPPGLTTTPSGAMGEEIKYPRKKKGKRKSLYTAGLREAFFDLPVLEVTKRQKDILDNIEYTGLESMPVLSLKEKVKKVKI